MMEFLEMNGYGEYIWPAYGVALILLAALLCSSLRQNKKLKAELQVIETQDKS